MRQKFKSKPCTDAPIIFHTPEYALGRIGKILYSEYLEYCRIGGLKTASTGSMSRVHIPEIKHNP